MLVSEIGYFQIRKNGLKDCSVATQAQKSNMSEGFGHYNGIDNIVVSQQVSDKKFINQITDLFKSVFTKGKQEDRNSVSIIA